MKKVSCDWQKDVKNLNKCNFFYSGSFSFLLFFFKRSMLCLDWPALCTFVYCSMLYIPKTDSSNGSSLRMRIRFTAVKRGLPGKAWNLVSKGDLPIAPPSTQLEKKRLFLEVVNKMLLNLLTA